MRNRIRSTTVRMFAIRNPTPKTKSTRWRRTWRDIGASWSRSRIRDPRFAVSGLFVAWRSVDNSRGARCGGTLQMRVEARAAACLVGPLRAEQHTVAAWDEALCVVRRIAADHADSQGLGDVFRDREQLRHRLERLAEIILIQSGNDD